MTVASLERNKRVSDRWDELSRIGRHGHFETLFQIVNEEVELALNDGPGKPDFDERRGAHLLSPGDAVRYKGEIYDVTGVHLATEHRQSYITMQLPNAKQMPELTVPLGIVEFACEIYLRAQGPTAR